MIDIFLSRPIWLSQEFKRGFDNFLKFLETHELKPRTIGAGDYPNEAPLDEVISLMNQCKGAIILGYPQIKVEKGLLKDIEIPSNTLKELYLPTEWNHIEAGLAYAKGLPLLVIHHIGVGRGIFDRGATKKFIYEVDLTYSDWSLTPEISGAFSKWKGNVSLQTPTPSEKISLSELIRLLEISGLSVKKGSSISLGVYNSEIAIWLNIDDKDVSIFRFATEDRAKEINEMSGHEDISYQYKHWVFNHVNEDIVAKLNKALKDIST